MKNQLNNKKVWLFKGKITKSAITFSENKPNSPIVQVNVSLFIAMIYTIFASLTKVKNKPNQSQYKPNSNPIAERVKMNVRNALTMTYGRFIPLSGRKNKPNSNPKQSQKVKCEFNTQHATRNQKQVPFQSCQISQQNQARNRKASSVRSRLHKACSLLLLPEGARGLS